jgi:hypothetical protein
MPCGMQLDWPWGSLGAVVMTSVRFEGPERFRASVFVL